MQRETLFQDEKFDQIIFNYGQIRVTYVSFVIHLSSV